MNSYLIFFGGVEKVVSFWGAKIRASVTYPSQSIFFLKNSPGDFVEFVCILNYNAEDQKQFVFLYIIIVNSLNKHTCL